MKESLVMLGKSALESKLFDEAEEYFQEAIKTDKNNPQIKILLAEAKYQQGLNYISDNSQGCFENQIFCY